MIKTRLMLQQEARGVRNYRSAFHCAYQVSHQLAYCRIFLPMQLAICEVLSRVTHTSDLAS